MLHSSIGPITRRAFGGFLLTFVVCAGVTLRSERLPIRVYTTADGLPHNVVYRIVTDSRGFLWFCTKSGLARFDGRSFTNFGSEQGVPEGGVNDLLETRSGEYWVATGGGLALFNPKGNPTFRVVASSDGGRLAGTVNVLREGRDGTVWAGTRDGLHRIGGAAHSLSMRAVKIDFLAENAEQREINDILEDRFGTLWIAAPGGLYRRWPDGSTARYPTRGVLPGNYLTDLFEDHEGHLWVATRDAGFFSLAADASHAPPVVTGTFGLKDGLPDLWVNQLFDTTDGRFWVATGVGLAEFFPHGDARGRRFRAYTEQNGLSYHYIGSLNEDRDGNLWMAAHQGGALKLSRDGFTMYGRSDGINRVDAIFEDAAGDLCFRGYAFDVQKDDSVPGGRIGSGPLVFTATGCFDGRRVDWFEPDVVKYFEPGNVPSRIWGWVLDRTTLMSRSGEFWLGTQAGAYRFAANKHFAGIRKATPLAVYTTQNGLAAAQVSRLFEDASGNIWVATTANDTNGLSRWEAATEHMLDLDGSPGLPSMKQHAAQSFGEDASGAVWIGFRSSVIRYARDTFTPFGDVDGLPEGTIKDIHRDRSGRLWLASDRSGLIRVDHPDAAHPAFRSYGVAQGLSSNDIQVIAEDQDGFLYVGAGQGLDRFDPETGRVKHFSADDGLLPGTLNAGFYDRHGVLWFGMSNGLARMTPRRRGAPLTAPRALVSAVRVGGVAQIVSALGEQAVGLPDFAPDQNHVEIDFVALGFGAGEVLRYQYKLEGADVDWRAPTAQRTVNFASLASGRYTFLVRALNSDGMMSDPPASVRFTILRPIWLRWWFVTLAALAFGAMLFAVYRYRVARVLEMAAIRTRIATDLHDDIGANLTRIGMLSEVAKRSRDDASLASIGSIARESVEAMSDIVWAINPNRESLADLVRRMRHHVEELFTLRGIGLRFNAPGANDALRLPMDLRRDLLLVFKEAVNNAARHSRCTQVSIDLSCTGSTLTLSVADNGVGFDTSQEAAGQGLASLRRRAARMKGTIDVQSGPSKGTTVTLRVPL